MKKLMVLAVMGMMAMSIVGCSSESQNSAKELGNDMKRDINKVAQDVDRKVDDATD